MTFPATAFTVVSGGINRLRTKAGPSKDSLYDLLNGYVTQAGSVKVRPGTLRNADISAYAGAGTTKGLVAYQNALHTFSAEVVSVPPNYALHVLTHPAYSDQPGTGTSNTTLSWTSGTTGNYVGYNNGDLGTPPNMGSGLSPTSLVGSDGHTYSISGLFTNTVTGVTTFALYDPSNTATQTGVFNEITFERGTPHIVYFDQLSSASTFVHTGTESIWTWPNGTFTGTPSGGQLNFSNIGTGTGPVDGAIIPLKEIHFAAPYLGGLYVVAEFDTSTNSAAAALGSVFHYWIQSSTGSDNANVWTASTDYLIGDVVIPSSANGLTYIASRRYTPAPPWTASTQKSVSDVVEPTVPNGFQYTVQSTLGTNPATGATEPTWPTTDGATVVEQSTLANDSIITVVTTPATQPTPGVPTRYQQLLGGNS